MGICLSRRNKDYSKVGSDGLDGNLNGDNQRYKQSSFNTKIPNEDYRVDLIEAFVADSQQQLYNTYLLTDFDIFCIIPKGINDLILKYFSKYQVYGIRAGSIYTINNAAIIPLFNPLEAFENTLANPSYLVHGNNNTLIMKTLHNEIYSISCDKYDDIHFKNFPHSSHSSETILDPKTGCKNNKPTYFTKLCPFQSITTNHNYSDENLLFNDNPSESLQRQIEFISNSFDGFDDQKIYYKLTNGDIYFSNIVSKTNKLEAILYDDEVENIIDIQCGQQHTLFLSDKGRVYAMGKNHKGQCGISMQRKMINKPTLIDTFIDNSCFISSISCGKNHSCAIDDKTGKLYIWGCNKYNQCIDDKNIAFIWKPIIYDENGKDPSINLLTDWDNYWSDKNYDNKRIIKAKCGRNSIAMLYKNGDISILGDLSILMKKLPKNNKTNIKFKDFDIGIDHILMISLDDKIYSFGQYDKQNCYMLKQKMFPNLANNSMVNTVIATPNNTIVIFN